MAAPRPTERRESAPPIPPRTFAREYNAAHDLIERNLLAGRAGKTAYIDDTGRYSYGDLAERANRCANALLDQGLRPEDRVLLCLLDSIDFPTTFLGCIKAGIVPIAANTLLTPGDYGYMLNDSRAKGLIVSAALLPQFEARLGSLPVVIVSGESSSPHASLHDLLARAPAGFAPAPTRADDMCFWAYSSGSTGIPKGVVHAHSSLIQTAELYAKPVMGIREDDVVFSAAKLFFAYGLGNALTFPLAAGATAVLMAERPTPAAVAQRLKQHQPTVFYGVPTLFAAMLASPDLPKRSEVRLRIATSAGEALPAQIGRRFSEHFGIDLLDGIGSTEMLHVFLSNRPGDVRHGTTGLPVPGYELRLVDDAGDPVQRGETGELQIKGPTQAIFYWNNRERTQSTFLGPWTRSGDKFSQDADGYYVYAGRSDDMLKVGGIYVSPTEVESALISHASVLEAAVVGSADADRLVKPKAFVVLKPGLTPSPTLAQELKQHVKEALAPYKYPRWIEFVTELPKTATGKIQRFKLRALDQRP
ncbi:MAG: benzoate-CoA ligase family protein [Betaproteobacteria bacterium]|nr:benzoate-CoA ligase family protein [Betaproteobacteria bacterium]